MAAVPRAAGSARATQSGSLPRDRIAEALYTWCCTNHEFGHVFNQDELLASGIIPKDEIQVLLDAVTHLTQKSLLRTHDVRGSGGIAWELVSQERAEK